MKKELVNVLVKLGGLNPTTPPHPVNYAASRHVMMKPKARLKKSRGVGSSQALDLILSCSANPSMLVLKCMSILAQK